MGRRLNVTKVGGAALTDPSFLAELTRHVHTLVENDAAPLLVHGGGPEIARLHQRLDIPFEFSEGMRVTRGESMEVVTMVLAGLLNKRLVARLVSSGLRAVGISGVDAGMLRAAYLDRDRWGEVGGEPEVQPGCLYHLLDRGYIPVVAPVALGPDGNAINVNADLAAEAIAVALDAPDLDFVTDTPGVLRDERVVGTLGAEEIERLIEEGVVSGGMIPKLRAARRALESGVIRVRVGDLRSLEQETATEAVLL
ncbi:MAG: acetylglutamate kinase [Candidatus Eisenbacteria bacterium]|uniref:Acetylglutamate kinase n=1 Tax=Eiseniibacteriota bacterium TaxID=2212470 RepID=A0A956LZ57_UNCEI|nr:acetylglutamate kinase [Candidatus Eisenbacteria bacterium]